LIASVPTATGDAAVSLALLGATPSAAQLTGSTVTYANAHPGLDVRYIVDNERVKEELVLSSAPVGTAAPTFLFDLGLQGLSAAPQADGSIVFSDAGGQAAQDHDHAQQRRHGAAGGRSQGPDDDLCV